MEKIDKQAVGARIRAIREDIGMTMVEFGEWLETTQSAVSNWERGENLPNKYRIKRIATIGKISVQDLLHGVKRYMYGIEWWNGKWIREPKNKTLPVVFASEEAANDWLISKGYYKEGSAKKNTRVFNYVREVPVSHLHEWPDEEYARILKMEVME